MASGFRLGTPFGGVRELLEEEEGATEGTTVRISLCANVCVTRVYLLCCHVYLMCPLTHVSIRCVCVNVGFCLVCGLCVSRTCQHMWVCVARM